MTNAPKRLIWLLMLAACLSAGAAKADTIPTVRPVASAYMVSMGSSSLYDTYLTPVEYRGWNFDLRYERLQAMRFSPERWVMRLGGRAGGGISRNPAENFMMETLGFDLSWAMMRRWRPAKGLQLCAGGSTGVDVGMNYMPHNGNNPVAAKAAWTVGVEGAAAYSFKIWRLPLTLRYSADLPLVGVFFSPQYDELYYEIYLGNHAGLVHCAWPGNFFRLNQRLTADLHLGRTNLRLGYCADIFSSAVNNITTRSVRHEFVLGIVSEWISLRAGASDTSKARVISALY